MTCGRHVLRFTETMPRHVLQMRETVASHRLKLRERMGPDGAQGQRGLPGNTFDAENMDSVTIHAGMAVAVHSSGTGFIRADRGSFSTRAIGVATITSAPGTSLTVATLGPVELSDWTQATGQATLPARAILWLGSAGLLTATPPSANGQVSQKVGEAVGSLILDVQKNDTLILRR